MKIPVVMPDVMRSMYFDADFDMMSLTWENIQEMGKFLILRFARPRDVTYIWIHTLAAKNPILWKRIACSILPESNERWGNPASPEDIEYFAQYFQQRQEWLKTIIPVNDPDTYNKITALIPPIENFDIEAVVLKYN